jgi:hypothetical protein
LFNDIERGYGVNHADTNHHHNVGRQDLKNKRDDLIRQKNCAILATIGGLYASAETDGFSDNVPFVSLVGEIPTLPEGSKCVGGVSLESVDTAPMRRQHLVDHKGITDPSTVGLYRHKPDSGTTRTQVSKDEETKWNSSSTIFDSTGNFDQDLNGGASAVIPGTIKALVISASPFFLSNNNINDLVKAANKWLRADTSRLIVYPLQIYKEANPPPQAAATSGVKRIVLFGPDLHDALEQLGRVAKAAQSGAPGFVKRTDAALVSEL